MKNPNRDVRGDMWLIAGAVLAVLVILATVVVLATLAINGVRP